MHTLLYSCLQHQWGYRMRACRGDASILSATARVDEALKHGLLSYSPHALLNDELLARRIRLPVRLNRLGIRSQADLLAPAWTGCFVQACDAFTDRVNGLGEVVLPGSFPLLGRIFGDGAFDMGGARVESFVSSNTRCLSSARGLREHWAVMRARAAPEAGAAPATGTRSLGVHKAGLQASMSEDSNVLPAPTARTMRSTRAAPGRDAGRGDEAVSYTHLTLPTICSV